MLVTYNDKTEISYFYPQNMQKIVVQSKKGYFIVAGCFAVAYILIAVVFDLLIKNQVANTIVLLVMVISCYIFWQGIYFVTRDVYATMDIENSTLIFGNPFILEEAQLNEVKFVRKSILFNAAIVLIHGRQYRIFLMGEVSIKQLREYFNGTGLK
jgi:hypothetical protein